MNDVGSLLVSVDAEINVDANVYSSFSSVKASFDFIESFGKYFLKKNEEGKKKKERKYKLKDFQGVKWT